MKPKETHGSYVKYNLRMILNNEIYFASLQFSLLHPGGDLLLLFTEGQTSPNEKR